jgi:hypothetical protein
LIGHLHIVSYRWGTRYVAEDVNILAASVARHLTVPHTMHCVTDDPAGLEPGIHAHPLPDEGVDGIWRKLGTFRGNFLGLKGEFVVSFDLDVVVVGSLDFLANRPDVDFWVARNWARGPDSAQASGSVYRLRVGSRAAVWDDFIADPAAAVERHHGKNRLIGEQNWLQHKIGTFTFFPEGKVVSFKRHCGARGHRILGLNTARFGVARPPAGAAVVSFHGDPLPRDVRDGPSGRWRRAPFVAEHWRA